MKREKKYKVSKLYIIKCGKYELNKNVKPAVYTCTIRYGNNGGSVKEWHENHYQCDYDPSSEYITIGYLSWGSYSDIVHGGVEVLRGLGRMMDSYKSGDSGYEEIERNAGELRCRGSRNLASAFPIDKKKLTYSEILDYYRVLTGEKQLEEVRVEDIKDSVLRLIISTERTIEQSGLIAEVKDGLIEELRSLGEEYDRELRRLRVSSPNFEASKQMLKARILDRVAEIELRGSNQKNGVNDNDIRLFRRLMGQGEKQ